MDSANDSLVSTAWLESALGTPGLVVLDASKHLPSANRDAAAEFEASHVPGAHYFDLTKLVDDTSPVPMACPRPEQLAALLSKAGVGEDDRVVFYDDSAVKTAARAWFLCREAGFDKVSVLDGGLAKWRAEGRPLESGSQTSAAKPLVEMKPHNRIRYKADMLANIDRPIEQVLDARDEGRFSGTTNDTVHDLPTGHIPGSQNLPFTRLFNDDGTYKPAAELRAAFEQAGIDLAQPVTTTCGSGVTASVLLFAMHLIGKDDTALYDGSWADWGSDPDTPKASKAAGKNV